MSTVTPTVWIGDAPITTVWTDANQLGTVGSTTPVVPVVPPVTPPPSGGNVFKGTMLSILGIL